MRQVRSPLRRRPHSPRTTQLQAPHPQGSVLRFPKHLLDGPSDPCPHFQPTSTPLWLLSPWALGSVPTHLAHRHTGWAEACRGLWLKLHSQSAKNYWPTAHFEYAVNLASLKRREFQIQLGMGSWTDTPQAGLPLQGQNLPRTGK